MMMMKTTEGEVSGMHCKERHGASRIVQRVVADTKKGRNKDSIATEDVDNSYFDYMNTQVIWQYPVQCLLGRCLIS